VCAPLDASGIDVTLVNNQIRFAGGFTALSNGGFASADFLVAYHLNSTLAIGGVGSSSTAPWLAISRSPK
jgi:hypothetical protein